MPSGTRYEAPARLECTPGDAMSDDTRREDDTWDGPRGEGAGGRIGPYTLVRLLGEGSFGEVYEASQEQPVKRRVALKIVKLGMDSREIVARFDTERQALALMDHPHVARVLDAGTTERGRPYFVMELVDGEPITAYCDNNRLDVAARLRLFVQVCEGVQHAHTKGIIHRDLKPGNVLTHTHGGQPFAKIIDFGIAKATQGTLGDASVATALHQMVGTPRYMSPEQASGSLDIDTRTDVYALGVILYELLTGGPPMLAGSLRTDDVLEIRRIICDVDPPRPSARLADPATALGWIAERRATDARRLLRAVRGELDWIVMKAIEKERGRRYETASALAEDIGRYLRSESVKAAPPSTGYRMRTFVRRHRGAVVAATLVAMSLLLGLTGFAWQAQVARQQARIAQEQTRRADERAAELEQVSGFQSDMLDQVDPAKAGQHLSKVVRAKLDASLAADGVPDAQRQAQLAAFDALWHRIDATDTAVEVIDASILKPALRAIDEQFGKQPLVDAQLREAISDTYDTIGRYETSVALQRDVLAKRLRVLGHDAPDTQLSVRNLANELETSGRLEEAEVYFRDAVATSRRLHGEENRETLEATLRLAGILDHRGHYAQAEALDRYVAARAERVFGPHDHKTFSAAQELGRVLHDENRLLEAEPWLRKALAGRIAANDESRIVPAMDDLAQLLRHQGRIAEAVALERESAERTVRLYGAENPESLKSTSKLGSMLLEQGKYAEAEPVLRRTLATARRVLGKDDPDMLHSVHLLGVLLLQEGKTAEAEPLLREALDNRMRLLGAGDRDTLVSRDAIAELYLAQRKFAQAEGVLASDEAAARRVFTDTDERRLGRWLLHLGVARAHLGQAEASKAALQEASRLLSRPGGATHDADVREVAEAMRVR